MSATEASGGGGGVIRTVTLRGYDGARVFDDELMAGAGVDTLVDLLRAATFLRVAKLVDLAAREVARRMRGKTVEETRALFGIRSDYTKQEVEDIRNEISWAFYTCHDD
uniref:SKP1 component dimerisation domain-containing protein n=1 Tax=Oryza brachyantha TaxID=4533 RepID=J3LB10_ORYBR